MTDQLIGDIAVKAIDKIMQRKGIPQLGVGINIESGASFRNAMKYIWRHEGNGAVHSGPKGHRYRIDRYRHAIHLAQPEQERIQQIDLGCGGGTFTWALLEWCIREGIDLSTVRLHSYDYARKMVKAARLIHRRIRKRHTQDIPNLNARSNYLRMLESIPANPAEPTHYIITAGYVIANNHSDEAVKDFTAIIKEVFTKSGNNPCSLVVCDTLNENQSNGWATLEPAYDNLVGSLEATGVHVNTRFSRTGSRIAKLSWRGV